MILIRHYEGINRTPALKLAARGWVSLLDAGYAADVCVLYWSHNAFVAAIDGVPVGVLVYDKVEHDKALHVVLGYVVPECRRKGIYRQLFQKVVEKARELKLLCVTGGVDIDNEAILRVSESLGRQRVGAYLHYAIVPEPEAEKEESKS